jgi:lactate dehydrogenase-like 2-hydroxyacid dehydrogenase
MTRPVILQAGPLTDADNTALDAAYDVKKLWLAPDRDAFITEHAPAIRGLVTRGDVGASADLIAALPRLEIIACFGVGVDAIDLPAAKARGVIVTNTPDVLTEDVADIGMALILATLRGIVAGDRHLRDGLWPAGPRPLGTSPRGKVLGIYGLGRIGIAVAKRAEASGMAIAYHNRSPRADLGYAYHGSLLDLAKGSDVLLAIAASTPENRRAVNAEVLEALGSNGFFINLGRGNLVDEEALIAALHAGTIAGAGLDVYDNEPRIDPRFAGCPNTVLLPHIGSATRETRAAMGQLTRDNLAAHFAGGPALTPV